jgi:hypothetical protein
LTFSKETNNTITKIQVPSTANQKKAILWVVSLRIIKKLNPDDKIRFKTDDFTGAFQLFRIDKYPNSYKDFGGNMIASVNTDVNINTPQIASAASFIDDIQPNKKYYYTSRSIDIHGNISNPGSIFCVEMVNNSGTVFPIIEAIDLNNNIKKNISKSFRKYIQIKPSFEQIMIQKDKVNIINKNLANIVITLENVPNFRFSADIFKKNNNFEIINHDLAGV